MMGGLDNWNTRSLVNCCIVCLFLCIQSVVAQPGFVSIHCCSDKDFVEPNTSINWIPDDYWYPDNRSCQDTTPVQDDTGYNRARVFDSGLGHKWCYNLTTERDQDYSVRGTFLSGDHQRRPSGSGFNVSIDATVIGVVKSSGESKVEGIFKATKDYVNFCLLQGQRVPYISKLELRPLTSDYLNRDPSSVLNLIDRVDAGNEGGDIRYPLDRYDRIWRADKYSDPMANRISSSSVNVTRSSPNLTFPPIEVLQTALTHPERLEFSYNNLDSDYHRYDLLLYFLELNDQVKVGQRVFDVYVNDAKKTQVDVALSGTFRFVVLNVTANGYLNLTMVRLSNGSQYGPIISAYEILQVHPLIQETGREEVDNIIDVKNEFLRGNPDNELLASWLGDPCLPISWPGLSCELANGTSVITTMNLSSSMLGGPLPPSLTKLFNLKELDTSHTSLVGNITELVTSLPNLTTLHYDSSPYLSNRLPASLRRSNLTTDKDKCIHQASRHSARGVVIGVVTGVCILVTIAIGAILVCRKKGKLIFKRKYDANGLSMTKNAVYSVPSTDIILRSISIQSFTLQYIEAATQKYKTLIGEGGFGSVYRGTLPDGQEVAVKVRSATSTQGTREFDNELNLLSAIRHENLVPLLGYCCENDQQILVYPFMSNGSLQDRLYGEAAKRKILDWPTRLSIALGAARGLTYLHTFAGRSVIHRDVKSSNILLDQSMCAKVADFGFSKYAPQEGDSGTSLEVRGTAGYLDPEYYSTQHLSAKSDVFSFGVVLLEIVSGREPLNINRPRNEWSLVEWAKPRIRNSRIEEIVDPSIKGGYHAEAMWRVVEVALACIEPYSAYRPCMADIVRELEDALIIENNASEYMKSIDSFGGSTRYSLERPIVILPTPNQTEASPILSQPPPPQPR
ncbi:nodulation receptor kinase [Coffea arabica]|uniref:Nodulation receptor kinase n=1 Tax=Coffea arabica TaxID=13443 RepID=A0A6P6TDW8_COFAR|nr:nodulation receptor kinase-like [Coffea arabica]